MKTPKKVKASQLADEALAEFIVLQNQVHELEKRVFEVSSRVRSVQEYVGRIEKAIHDGNRLEGNFAALDRRIRWLEETVLPEGKGSTRVLQDILGDDRYAGLLNQVQGGIAYGIPVENMGREDLMVLVMLHIEEKTSLSQELSRQLDLMYGT